MSSYTTGESYMTGSGYSYGYSSAQVCGPDDANPGDPLHCCNGFDPSCHSGCLCCRTNGLVLQVSGTQVSSVVSTAGLNARQFAPIASTAFRTATRM
eukprot:3939532-Rhodomonas_salina.1